MALLEPPQLIVSLVSAELLARTQRCEVVWRLENQGSHPIELTESWLPHGQFRALREPFVPPLILPVGGAVLHSRQVNVALPAGGCVENAFLILRALYRREAWRIFVRMNIEAASDLSVRPIVEVITASPISPEP